ncbi:MAG: regulatory iron-sulfur-containing complex subunit RicT [Acidobacteriota bacterium]|nr:regulatory iron-sulfur-containing complex subunit RicT [Acidobacteriota bacterium]
MPELVLLISERTGRMIRARRNGLEVDKGDLCLVDSEFGGELAVIADTDSAICCQARRVDLAPVIVRKAGDEDVRKMQWLEEREQRAFEMCLQKIRSRGLPMKLTAVRYFFNEKKGVFFYTADGRVDFRQLVKDLAKELRMRIEMRQVGVRDEAKILGGLGVCGRALCCASFMRTFEPVTIQKARKQHIAINPTKISGLCGRLMCCLAFEDETRGRMYYEEESANED